MNEKEKWIKEVLQSTNGIRRVSPRPDLLTEIENKIHQSDVRIFSLSQARMVAAVACFLLVCNIAALYQQPATSFAERQTTDAMSDQSLITNYNIYE